MPDYKVTLKYRKRFPTSDSALRYVMRTRPRVYQYGLPMAACFINFYVSEYYAVLEIHWERLLTKWDADQAREKLRGLLADLDIQSDEVYLEIERMMDTRIDCSTAAGGARLRGRLVSAESGDLVPYWDEADEQRYIKGVS